MNKSKREFLKFLGVSSFAAGCSGESQNRETPTDEADPLDGQTVWTTQGIQVPALASFDNMMQSFMQARSIPGGSLAVTRGGKLAMARGYSYTNNTSIPDVQPTSLFRIASISKPITATAVLSLAQDNQLDLSSQITDIVSLMPALNQSSDTRLVNISVLNLLQHLSGWDSSIAFDPMFQDFRISNELGVPLPISRDDIVTYMAGQPLQHTPGTRYAYSNFGYSLLGKIIETVTGLPYEDYVKQRVFATMNISRPKLGRSLLVSPNEVTYYSQYNQPTVFDSSGSQVPSPYGGWNIENMDAHGGWLASAVDLVRFASTFDVPASNPVLNQSSIETMFGLPENISSADYSSGDAYYANGWLVRDYGNGSRNTWHNGSLPGTSTLLVRRRDGLNWCVLFNQRQDSSGLSYTDIDGLLHNAADSVSVWPDHDLFETYL